MKVILREDIAGVGRRGDIVDVADGHARNFLLPKGKAISASAGAVNQAESMRKARDVREASAREAARESAAKLAGATLTVPAKAGNEGRLFGSVTAADVADAIVAGTGVAVDRKQINVGAVRTLGEHSATVRLHADVECTVSFTVVAA